MIRKAKGFEPKFDSITHLNTFGSNIFDPKNMNFETMALIKFVHIYLIKGMNA